MSISRTQSEPLCWWVKKLISDPCFCPFQLINNFSFHCSSFLLSMSTVNIFQVKFLYQITDIWMLSNQACLFQILHKPCILISFITSVALVSAEPWGTLKQSLWLHLQPLCKHFLIWSKIVVKPNVCALNYTKPFQMMHTSVHIG